MKHGSSVKLATSRAPKPRTRIFDLIALALGFMTASLAPISQALAQEDGAISEPQRAIVYPDLGDEAPKVAVVFDAPAGEAKIAAIYALVEQRWILMHHGDYTRGSLLAGRGGKGNRFRLVTQAEGFVDLSFANKNLQLFSGGERTVLQPK